MPRALTANLASVPVTLDFAGGNAKYRKMDDEYTSIILRGTVDTKKMPIAGMFFSGKLVSQITEKLAGENITPERLYFSGDDWQEYGSSGLTLSRTRRVFATFTYHRGADQCFYGVAEVTETFDFMNSKFGEAEITLQKDFSIPCTDIK
jgi:hypothetical protein